MLNVKKQLRSCIPVSINMSTLVVLISISIGFAIRLVLAHGSYNFDITNFVKDISIVNSGKNIYIETVYYNYSPLFLIFLKLADAVSNLFLTSKEYAIRALLAFVDIIIIIILKRIGEKTLTKKQLYLSLVFFALNPVSIILTGHHGQFENLALLFLLLAYMLSISNSSTKWVFLCATIALCIKHSVVFLVLYFFLFTFRFKKGIILFILSCVIFLCLFIPFLSADNLIRVKDQVFGYSGLGTFYGISYFLEQIFGEAYRPYQAGIVKYIFLLVTSTFVIYKAHIDKELDLLSISLFFLTFTTGIGDQYFVVPVILSSLKPNRAGVYFSVGCALYLLGSASNFDIPMFKTFTWNCVWFLIAIWLIENIVNGRYRRLSEHSSTIL